MNPKRCLLLCLTMAALSAKGQVLTYQLLPGSTITPMNGPTITGPTEQLTGTFQMRPATTNFSLNTMAFLYVSFNLASPSYSFSLLDTYDKCSLAINSSSFADVNVDVAVSGLSIASGTIDYYPNPGSYVGPYYQPTELDFPTERIAAIGGGLWAAQMSFDAVLVPEPTAQMLIAFGLLVLSCVKAREARKYS